MDRGLAQCADLMSVANDTLSESAWLSGREFGFGDIPLGCIAYAWFSMPIARPMHPALEAWYVRLTERPAYRKAVMTGLT